MVPFIAYGVEFHICAPIVMFVSAGSVRTELAVVPSVPFVYRVPEVLPDAPVTVYSRSTYAFEVNVIGVDTTPAIPALVMLKVPAVSFTHTVLESVGTPAKIAILFAVLLATVAKEATINPVSVQ